MEWQPIETAPKDGTRVMLWRGPCRHGVWNELAIAEWHDNAWRWPAQRDTPSNCGPWHPDHIAEGYADSKNFTHWMPLPAPPAAKEERG